MHVFVTGGSGWIGPALIDELLTHGHKVTALARSDNSAAKLQHAGAEVLRGDIEDLDSLRAGAAAADGVIHLAFILDFSDFARGGETEKAALQAMAEAVKGSGKPIVYASGTMMLPKGKVGKEGDEVDWDSPFSVRAPGDVMMREMARDGGVRTVGMRLPPAVHGAGDKWQLAMMVEAARKNGFVAYVGNGEQRWPTVHRNDAAAAFRLALEKGAAGAVYHPVAEGGVRMKDVADTIAKRLGLSTQSTSGDEAQKALGFLAFTMSMDNPVSSEKTREELGWEPKELAVIADMEANYFG